MSHIELKTFDNSWYKPANKLIIVLWLLVNRVILYSSIPIPLFLKTFVLRIFGAHIGKGVIIKPKVSIKYPWLLEVGNYVWIGEQVWIDNLAKVKIHDNVCLSQGAMLLCGNHNYKRSSFDLIVKEIILEEGVWIGAQSTVCPGVICKSHSILSVGSVATKDLKPFTIYQGVPAAPVRKRNIED